MEHDKIVDLRIEFTNSLARKEKLTDLCRARPQVPEALRGGVAGLEAPKVIRHKTSAALIESVVAERRVRRNQRRGLLDDLDPLGLITFSDKGVIEARDTSDDRQARLPDELRAIT